MPTNVSKAEHTTTKPRYLPIETVIALTGATKLHLLDVMKSGALRSVKKYDEFFTTVEWLNEYVETHGKLNNDTAIAHIDESMIVSQHVQKNVEEAQEDESREYISLAEAEKIAPYSAPYLALRIRQGKMQGKKIGRTWHTTKEWVEEYMAAHSLKAVALDESSAAVDSQKPQQMDTAAMVPAESARNDTAAPLKHASHAAVRPHNAIRHISSDKDEYVVVNEIERKAAILTLAADIARMKHERQVEKLQSKQNELPAAPEGEHKPEHKKNTVQSEQKSSQAGLDGALTHESKHGPVLRAHDESEREKAREAVMRAIVVPGEQERLHLGIARMTEQQKAPISIIEEIGGPAYALRGAPQWLKTITAVMNIAAPVSLVVMLGFFLSFPSYGAEVKKWTTGAGSDVAGILALQYSDAHQWTKEAFGGLDGASDSPQTSEGIALRETRQVSEGRAQRAGDGSVAGASVERETNEEKAYVDEALEDEVSSIAANIKNIMHAIFSRGIEVVTVLDPSSESSLVGKLSTQVLSLFNKLSSN